MELPHILNLKTDPFSAQFVFYKKFSIFFEISSNLDSKNGEPNLFFEPKLLKISEKMWFIQNVYHIYISIYLTIILKPLQILNN